MVTRKIKKIIKIMMETETFLEVVAKFFLPFVISALVILGLWLTGTRAVTEFLYVTGIYLFTPPGMVIGLPMAIAYGVPVWTAIAYMIFADAMASLWIIWNLNLLRKVPLLGYIIKRTQHWGQSLIKKNPNIGKFEFIGLAIFVFVPVYGSGSVMGSVIGKLLGMKEWKIFVSVMLGVITRLIILGLAAAGILAII